MTKYRIVRDEFAGFEVQKKGGWWPFWRQCNFTNTHSSLENAMKAIPGYEKSTCWEGTLEDLQS